MCDLVNQEKFSLQVVPAMNVMKTNILLRLEQLNERTDPAKLCASVGSKYILRNPIGVAGRIRMNFISVDYWMCDSVAKRPRTFKESVQKVTKVEFEQFERKIGLESAIIDAHNDLMTIFRTT